MARKKEPNAFAVWVAGQDKSLTEIAKKLGIKIQTASNWKNGHTSPGRDLANKVYVMSGGTVPTTSWAKRKRRKGE